MSSYHCGIIIDTLCRPHSIAVLLAFDDIDKTLSDQLRKHGLALLLIKGRSIGALNHTPMDVQW